MIRAVLKYFKSYFLYGLIIIVPVASTIFVVYLGFQLLITPFNHFFSAKMSPIIGFLISIFAIVGIGFISRNVIGQLVLDLFDVLVSKIPLINRIYDSSKHLIDVFSSQKRDEMKPVLVEYPKDGMWVIGFLTFTSLETLGASEQSFYDKVSVFIPTTPNPTSGYVVFVDKEKIKSLDIGFEEAIKTLVSAGVISPK
tara:strand:- start:426 stop:1016 length:591 start_codon:yes stop_codon:yes gene_type:complete